MFSCFCFQYNWCTFLDLSNRIAASKENKSRVKRRSSSYRVKCWQCKSSLHKQVYFVACGLLRWRPARQTISRYSDKISIVISAIASQAVSTGTVAVDNEWQQSDWRLLKLKRILSSIHTENENREIMLSPNDHRLEPDRDELLSQNVGLRLQQIFYFREIQMNADSFGWFHEHFIQFFASPACLQ